VSPGPAGSASAPGSGSAASTESPAGSQVQGGAAAGPGAPDSTSPTDSASPATAGAKPDSASAQADSEATEKFAAAPGGSRSSTAATAGTAATPPPASRGKPAGTGAAPENAGTAEQIHALGPTPPSDTEQAGGEPTGTDARTAGAATESAAPDAKTVAIPKPGPRPGSGPPADDQQTVAIPKVSNPSDDRTMVLPVQQPDATEKIRTGRPAPAGTDRVVQPAGGPAPVTRPPATPRPGAGPKNPVPQGPASPAQSAPPAGDTHPAGARPPVPLWPAAAPSPADIKPTVPEHSVTRPVQGPRPIAQPQHVPPAKPAGVPDRTATSGRRKRRLIIAGAAVLVVAIVAAVVGLIAGRTDNSPQAQVRTAITTYATALASGNLSDLRNATCGQLHDFYQNIAPDQFAGVYKLSAGQKKIPKVSSVDAVQLTGDKAVAQASIYTDADPNTVTTRTFDLQHTADGWKVCDPPNAAQ
jgi:hypothetical protein